MTAYRCDRCGRYFGEMPEGCLTVWAEEEKLDLCPTCYRQLSKWVSGSKNKKPAPEYETPELNGGFIFR